MTSNIDISVSYYLYTIDSISIVKVTNYMWLIITYWSPKWQNFVEKRKCFVNNTHGRSSTKLEWHIDIDISISICNIEDKNDRYYRYYYLSIHPYSVGYFILLYFSIHCIWNFTKSMLHKYVVATVCYKIMRTNNRKCKTCPHIMEFVHTFHGLFQDLKDMSEKTEDKIPFQLRHFLS